MGFGRGFLLLAADAMEQQLDVKLYSVRTCNMTRPGRARPSLARYEMCLVERRLGKMDGRRRLSDIEPLLELGVVVIADAAAWSGLGGHGTAKPNARCYFAMRSPLR